MKKNEKTRLLCLALAVLTVLSLVGCTGGRTDTQNTPTETPTAEPTEAPRLTMKQLGDALASTPYAESGLVSDAVYGLTDTEVGVNLAELLSAEKKYPIPADSAFAAIYDLSGQMSESKTAAENTAVFTNALAEAATVSGKKKIILPNGEIPLSSLPISNQTDLTVCGSGNTTIRISGWNTALWVLSCTNVYVSDLHITFDFPGMLTGRVLEASGRTVKVQMDEGFDLTDSRYNCVRGYYEMKKEPFGEDTYVLDIGKNTRYWQGDTFAVTDAANRVVTVTFSGDPVYETEAGTVVSLLLGHYTGNAAICVNGSKNTTLQSIRMDTLPGMGLTACYDENLYVDRLSITPDTSRGLYFATCHDGIHTVQVRGDFVLTNVLESGIEDDCLNVCSDWSYVKSISGKELTVVSKLSDFREGDTVEIYASSDLTPKGSFRIVGISGNTLTFDQDVPRDITEGFMVGNATAATHLTMENCYFANSVAHAGLIQCRDTVIRRCTFSNLTMGGLRVHCAIAAYSEAIMPRNVTIEKCKFFDCGLGDANFFAAMEIMAFVGALQTSIGVLEGVTIRNNFVSAERGGGVTLYGVGKSKVENNFFYDISRNVIRYDKSSFQYAYNMAVSCMKGINNTIQHNCVWVADPGEDFEAVKIDPKSTRKITENDNTYYHG